MPSFGQSAQDSENRGAATSRLINCYLEPVEDGTRTTFALKSVLGTEAFADVGEVFFNGAFEFQNNIYTAYDGNLIRVDSGGAANNLGAISSGDASFSSNNSYLTLAIGGTYYTYLGGVSNPTIEPFTGAGSVDYLDQYTLITEKFGRRWAWSDLADPTTIPALNFATAEATDDNLLRVIALNGRVVLFKETGREVWTNTGQSGADAFTRLAARNIGLKDFNLVARTDEALFFIGNDNIARITLDGLEARKLSYPPVDTSIANRTPTHCFYYEEKGHKFCVIRFSDDTAWIFDLATGEWHERAEGARHDPWSVLGTVKRGNDWFGCTDAGAILKLTRNNADASGILRRTAISPTYYFEEGASLDEMEIYARTGFSELGRDAQMWVRLSKDGGHTWSREKWRSLGTAGDYRQKATWRAQGLYEQLTVEANISDPAEIPLWSDFLLEAT